MIARLFLGAIVVAIVPLHASPHVYSEHLVTTHAVKRELPGSKELHEKIGKKGFVEKQYATLKFTKRTSEDVELTKIVMQWTGPRVGHLSGALFNQTTEELLPLHENEVAQGIWNVQKQQLSFFFKKPLPLRGTTTLSVVLTVNPELDALLDSAKGSFDLVTSSLPEAFQATKK